MNDLELDYEMLELLPPWYREVLDYQQICQTEQQFFEALAQEINAVADNFFFQTMDAGAVSQWEQILGITPNLTTESLQFRQARLVNRISTRPPYTMKFLQEKLDELIGPGQWTVTMDYPNYTLYVESSAENQQYATEVAYTINAIKPAHIVYANTPYVQTGLLLSETIELYQRQWNYNLGGWGLGVLPFASDISKGVIKMPTTPSIQQTLLTGTANFVSGDIESARINGSVVISDLEKTVSGSTLTVTYTVPQDQATEVTLAELLDSDGNVLTSSTVYVPVESNTVMKHVIPAAEGVNTNA